MVAIKRLSECTLEEAVQAYNSGFGDYYIPVKVNVNQFKERLVYGRMSPELSLLAFVDEQPIGFVLNGVQTMNGKKIARNGGTGVSADYRRLGAGKALMERTMEIYERENVDIAVLEAFSVNEKAISLYKKAGYEVTERLLFLERTSTFENNPFTLSEEVLYQAVDGIPRDAGMLSFYKYAVAWQNHWENIIDGETMLVQTHDGETVGYALYKQSLRPSGELAVITLYQCEVAPGREDQDAIMRFALSNVFAPNDAGCKQTTFNLPDSNQGLIKILREAGFSQAFTESNILLEQVHMHKWMK